MMSGELTPENAPELFGKLRELDPTGPSEPEPEPVELDDDEAELARRYSLAPEDVKRVRGATWADKCADAERLSKVVEPKSIRERSLRKLRERQEADNPNSPELLAALFANPKREQDRRFVEQLHPPDKGKGEADEGKDGEG